MNIICTNIYYFFIILLLCIVAITAKNESGIATGLGCGKSVYDCIDRSVHSYLRYTIHLPATPSPYVHECCIAIGELQ